MLQDLLIETCRKPLSDGRAVAARWIPPSFNLELELGDFVAEYRR
jgi:hypothetical protein